MDLKTELKNTIPAENFSRNCSLCGTVLISEIIIVLDEPLVGGNILYKVAVSSVCPICGDVNRTMFRCMRKEDGKISFGGEIPYVDNTLVNLGAGYCLKETLVWNCRTWDMYIDYHYAKFQEDLGEQHWTRIASRRYYANDGKWRGL